VLPSEAYQRWERAAASALVGLKPVAEPVHVLATIYYRGRRPDLSGALESIGDCLEGICWENDGQIVSWDGSRLHHDPKNPRTRVEVFSVDSRTISCGTPAPCQI